MRRDSPGILPSSFVITSKFLHPAARYSRKLQCFFWDNLISSLITLTCYFRCHRAGSQLKIGGFVPPFYNKKFVYEPRLSPQNIRHPHSRHQCDDLFWVDWYFCQPRNTKNNEITKAALGGDGWSLPAVRQSPLQRKEAFLHQQMCSQNKTAMTFL